MSKEEREKREIENLRNRKKFIGTVVHDDPHGEKEDNREVELRKKPRFSIDWNKTKREI